ncbi:MAG: hypothetical protein AAFQ98_12365 [Bacteroidota bacterium]
MEGPKTISKAPPQFDSQSWETLRTLGLEHIELLSKRIWTDYNTHDPGITLMEVLCYAITDLGYRASFPIQDLLTTETTTVQDHFHSAREVLACNPLTLADWRKLLIDIKGIKNAWLEATSMAFPKFYLNCPDSTLTYSALNKVGEKLDEIVPEGFYNCILEFDDPETVEGGTDAMGDLNSNTITYTFEVLLDPEATDLEQDHLPPLEGMKFELEVTFATWDVVNDKRPLRTYIRNISFDHAEEFGDYAIEVITKEDPLEFVVQVFNLSTLDRVIDADLSSALKLHLQRHLGIAQHPDPLMEADNLDHNVLARYRAKLTLVRGLVKDAKTKLHEHRNLCEDFLRFSSLRVEEIGICADIDLKADADPTLVQGEIYYRIEQFLSPRVYFHTLQEMYDDGYATEDIFLGPALQHGFIKDDELALADRRRVIHVSDLIHEIMDIPGVVAVRDIQIANFPKATDANIPQKSVKWCLKLAYDQNFVPRMGYEHSRITFYKSDLPYMASENQALNYWDDLRDAEREARLGDTIEFEDREVPNVKFRGVGSYHSIQHDLPQTYGVGNIGVPKTATDLRKAQARQLQGYLTFFEQLLANYYSQLANLTDLFGLDVRQKDEDGIPKSDGDGKPLFKPTYPNQPLTEVPGFPHQVADFIKDWEGHSKQTIKDEWATYVSKEKSPYRSELARISEPDPVMVDRRNRFLDHLMARFNEQFADYAVLMYILEGEEGRRSMIEDKVNLLKHYPEVSGNRGKGFNYVDSNRVWDIDNVSGLENRFRRLLGIQEQTERKLVLEAHPYVKIYKDVGGNYRWRIYDLQENIILNSDKGYAAEEINAVVFAAMERGRERKHYDDTPITQDGKHYFHLLDAEGGVIGTAQNVYDSSEERDEALDTLVNFLEELAPAFQSMVGEGLHIIEHLLLRPRSWIDEFLPICSESQGGDCFDTDPYTFRIHVIFPAYAGRFRNMDFRKYVERTVRINTPAHIYPKICWISPEQMAELEEVYQQWLQLLARVSEPLDNLWPPQPSKLVGGTVPDLDISLMQSWYTERLEILHSMSYARTAKLLTYATENDGQIPLRSGEMILEWLDLLVLTLPYDGGNTNAEFNAAMYEAQKLMVKLLELEQIHFILQDKHDLNLSASIRYDDLRKVLPYINTEETVYQAYQDAIGHLAKAWNGSYSTLDGDDKEIIPPGLATPYAILIQTTFTGLQGPLGIMDDAVPEDLSTEALHRELLEQTFQKEYILRLSELEDHLKIMANLPADEQRIGGQVIQDIVLQAQQVLDCTQRYRLSYLQNRLLVILESLRNVYPSATLHDCEESDATQRPVSLDNTVLGSFTPIDSTPDDASDS